MGYRAPCDLVEEPADALEDLLLCSDQVLGAEADALENLLLRPDQVLAAEVHLGSTESESRHFLTLD